MHHAGGTSPVVANQQIDGGRWNYLGTYTLEPGQDHKVVLDVPAGTADRTVADAIRFERIAVARPVVAADAVKFVTNDAEAALYVHADHLGSPQKMSDASGAVVWEANFTPFGEEDTITGAANDNRRFPGQYFDEETGFHYNYFRDYDPSTGRYIESDPIGLAGGLNTYAYVGGRPLTYIDALGLRDTASGAMLLHLTASALAGVICYINTQNPIGGAPSDWGRGSPMAPPEDPPGDGDGARRRVPDTAGTPQPGDDDNDPQKHGRPGDNKKQNEQVRAAANKARLSREQRAQLGEEIELLSRKYGQNPGYREILEIAEKIKLGIY